MCHREQRSVVGRSIVAMTTRERKTNSLSPDIECERDGSARFEFVKLGGREGSRLKRRQDSVAFPGAGRHRNNEKCSV